MVRVEALQRTDRGAVVAGLGVVVVLDGDRVAGAQPLEQRSAACVCVRYDSVSSFSKSRAAFWLSSARCASVTEAIDFTAGCSEMAENMASAHLLEEIAQALFHLVGIHGLQYGGRIHADRG